jgi:hypothetical protein
MTKPKTSSVILRWKRQPNERGLARVSQGLRGWDLFMGAERLAHVRPLFYGLSRNLVGWYYVAPERPGIEYRNSCGEVGAPPAQARAACAAYVVACLSATRPGTTYKVHATVPGVTRELGEG